MNSEKYLITGAAGFIGSHVAEALVAGGRQVVGLDNFDTFYDPSVKRRNISALIDSPSFRLVEGDIREEGLVESILREEGIGTVIHLAARAGVRPSIEQPLLYQSVNVHGTSMVLEAMRNTGCRRLLFASSSSVYGNNDTVPFRESDNVDHPISPYAATKKAGELLCYTYHHLFGIDAACLRFFTVYGPRQRPEMAIHKFIRAIADGEEVEMFGDGSTSRDYTYIDDIVQGVLAIDANFSGYRVVNLGEAKTTTLAELVDMIAAAIGEPARVRRMPMQPGDVDRTCADISVACSLGYAPCTPIEDGIKRFVEWYMKRMIEAT